LTIATSGSLHDLGAIDTVRPLRAGGAAVASDVRNQVTSMSISAPSQRHYDRTEERMASYMLLLHESGTLPPDISPEEIQQIIQRYVGWRQKVEQGGRKIEGHKLVDGQGRVLRGKGSPAVTDGPYAEAREVIGGLFIVDARDYDEVVALCADHPHLDFGPIEIREIEPTG
jgi:hypothetical protein